PLGSLQGFLKHNRIKEHCEDKDIPSAQEMFSILSEDFTTLAKEIRKDIETLEQEGSKDSGTINLLEDIIEKLEKTNWMITANIE
ncbi:MAG: DNA starvation/stationary phase protection protein, partial [Odoribacter sp.]|nr:DNA starvation/stationary phase protection protein [Odoribacter sp.]